MSGCGRRDGFDCNRGWLGRGDTGALSCCGFPARLRRGRALCRGPGCTGLRRSLSVGFDEAKGLLDILDTRKRYSNGLGDLCAGFTRLEELLHVGPHRIGDDSPLSRLGRGGLPRPDRTPFGSMQRGNKFLGGGETIGGWERRQLFDNSLFELNDFGLRPGQFFNKWMGH